MALVTNNSIDGNFEQEIEFKASSYPNNRGKTETIKDRSCPWPLSDYFYQNSQGILFKYMSNHDTLVSKPSYSFLLTVRARVLTTAFKAVYSLIPSILTGFQSLWVSCYYLNTAKGTPTLQHSHSLFLPRILSLADL